MSARGALATVLKQHAALTSIGAAVASAGVVGGGLVVGAALLPSGSPRLAGGAVDLTDEALEALPPARRTVVDGLRQALRSSRALLDVSGPESGAPARVVLWLHDDHDPGDVNVDEILVLAHSPLLQTIYAISMAPAAEAPAPPAPDAVLFSPDVVNWLRSAPGGESRVIATNVQALRVSRLGADPEGERLRVTLTWPGRPTDQPAEGGVETAFTVTLPAVHRSR